MSNKEDSDTAKLIEESDKALNTAKDVLTQVEQLGGVTAVNKFLWDMVDDLRQTRKDYRKIIAGLLIVNIICLGIIAWQHHRFVAFVSDYDIITYSQDGNGQNNISTRSSTGTQGDLNYGATNERNGAQGQEAQGGNSRNSQ